MRHGRALPVWSLALLLAAGLLATAAYAAPPTGDWTFVQLSDIHW